MRRVSLVLLFLVAVPLYAQWTAIGDMNQPSRKGNALRFENAQAVAVITALSPQIIRVRITPGHAEMRDHSYAVVNRDLGDTIANVKVVDGRSTVTLCG